MTSEVFDKYIEIAKEKGLIKEAEGPNYTRYDSKDLDTIQMMYGLKPNGKEDDVSIIEKAHPEPVIIAPSYDRLNGLVENEQELHNIMMGIVTKPHQSNVMQHRYAAASSSLMNELVRIGFLMDNKNEEILCALADSCAESLSHKTAWTWSELGTGAGIGAGIGGLAFLGAGPVGWGLFAGGLAVMALINHFGNKIDQGVINNCETAINELNDVITDENNNNLSNVINKMIRNISYIKSLGTSATQTSVPDANISNAATFVNSSQHKKLDELLNNYAIGCETLAEQLPSYINILKNAPSVQNHHTGIGAVFFKVWETIYPPEIKDAISALETLQTSLRASKAQIDAQRQAVENYVASNKADIIKDIQAKIEKSHSDEKEPSPSIQVKNPNIKENIPISEEKEDVAKQLTHALLT